jgi:hypothetical protein
MMPTKKKHPIIIVDNFMGDAYSHRLHYNFFGPVPFPWSFLPDSTYPNRMAKEWNEQKILNPDPKDYSCSFSHMAYVRDDNNYKSEYYELFAPIMDNMMDLLQANLDFSRVRLGLHVNRQVDRLHNKPHIDSQDDHYAALYYVNESDGDTFLFDQYDSPYSGSSEKRMEAIDKEQLTIYKRISPRRNRLVIFDGHQVHASSEPKLFPSRVVINFNFIANKNIFENLEK